MSKGRNNCLTTHICAANYSHTNPCFLKTHHRHSHAMCYPCLGPVRPPRTTPSARRPSPSLLHGFHGNTFHWPPRLPSLITLATQVAASAHEAGAADTATLNITALGNRALRAAATGCTLVTLSVPPPVWLDQSQHRFVGSGVRQETNGKEWRRWMKTNENK